MTQDEIMEMAREVGCFEKYQVFYFTKLELEAFAKLVEAHTREKMFKPDWDNYRQGLIDGAVEEREACAYQAGIALLGADRGLANRVDQAIRARGEA